MQKINKYILIFLLFFLFNPLFAQECKNIDDLRKGIKSYYDHFDEYKKTGIFKSAPGMGKSLQNMSVFCSKNPDVLLKLNQTDEKLIEKFLYSPCFDLLPSSTMEEVLYQLIETSSSKIKSPNIKKQFVLQCLVNDKLCLGSQNSIKLWNKVQKIPYPPEKLPQNFNLILQNKKLITKTFDNFKKNGEKISKDQKIYLCFFSETPIGKEYDTEFSFEFDNLPDSELINQEKKFIKTFQNALKEKKNSCSIELKQLFRQIEKEAVKSDLPGSANFIRYVLSGDSGPQIVISNKEKINYILAFPHFKEFLFEADSIGGFYLCRIIYDGKGHVSGLSSFQCIPKRKDFQSFIKKQIIPKMYKKIDLSMIEMYKEELRDTNKELGLEKDPQRIKVLKEHKKELINTIKQKEKEFEEFYRKNN